MYLAGLVLQTNMGSMCVQFAALIAPNQDIAFVLAAGALCFFGCEYVWRVYESVWVW